MIASIASSILVILIGVLIKAHLLSIAINIFMTWVRVISAIMPPEEREGRRDEALSWVFEKVKSYQQEGYTPSETAIRLLEDCAKGVLKDIVSCAPFIPRVVADRVVGWSNTLRHYRISAAMVAGVAVLAPINYSFFVSPANQPLSVKLMANGVLILVTVLLWNLKHPLVRQIFQAWMWIAMAGGVGIMVWITVHFYLYTNQTFKMLMLAMLTVLPTIIVVDKSWRQRLFRGKWWLIPICWTPIIAGALAGSILIAHSIKPLVEMWAAMGLLVIGMLMVCVLMVLGSYVLCWLGIRGGAGGLRLVASGIRRLR